MSFSTSLYSEPAPLLTCVSLERVVCSFPPWLVVGLHWLCVPPVVRQPAVTEVIDALSSLAGQIHQQMTSPRSSHPPPRPHSPSHPTARAGVEEDKSRAGGELHIAVDEEEEEDEKGEEQRLQVSDKPSGVGERTALPLPVGKQSSAGEMAVLAPIAPLGNQGKGQQKESPSMSERREELLLHLPRMSTRLVTGAMQHTSRHTSLSSLAVVSWRTHRCGSTPSLRRCSSLLYSVWQRLAPLQLWCSSSAHSTSC